MSARLDEIPRLLIVDIGLANISVAPPGNQAFGLVVCLVPLALNDLLWSRPKDVSAKSSQFFAMAAYQSLGFFTSVSEER
jgi:hypothetical protein